MLIYTYIIYFYQDISISCCYVQEQKAEDQRQLTASTLELRQQAEYLSSGNDQNRLMTQLGTTAVDDWGAVNGSSKKKVCLHPCVPN